jgi:hypothetical protein
MRKEDGSAHALSHKPGGANYYRDELNFAEFPIASVADTIPENVKTLEFTDEIFDESAKRPVLRTLVITAADKFGLPTALDDEVMVALTQLSAETDFADRKVHFSRYQLIKLLGWRDDSKSYKRIEDSLNRWAGVTLQYKKAWWSKEEKCWVNETFHIIDQVTVFDRERIERRRKMAKDSPEKALSSFVWNETVFNSFKAGNLKSIDFDIYKTLRSAIAKRMFRFLDKRFYHRPTWEFDLQEFACEHIGLSRNYTNAQLKRKLLPAILELEEHRFLKPMPPEERFFSHRQGQWKALFVKAPHKVSVLGQSGEETRRLVETLVSRGITRKSAEKLVSHHASDRIEEKVRLYDWMKSKGGEGRIKNRAGWLYSAVVHDYALPPELAPKPLVQPGAAASTRPTIEVEVVPEMPPAKKPSAFEEFWSKLSPDEQVAFEAEAVAAAPVFLRRQYEEGQAGRGSLWQVARGSILKTYFDRTAAADAT